MPFTHVKIDTVQCGADRMIKVDQQVAKVLQKGDQIKFHNNLDGNVEATIRFYPGSGHHYRPELVLAAPIARHSR